MPTVPTNAARDAARTAMARIPAVVVELDLDRCTLTHGTAPCTATGTPCYNTRGSCQDKANYVRGTQTLRFCSRGMPLPPGQTLRPYILDVSAAVSEIDIEQGLARRGSLTLQLADEPDADVELDPYVTTRSTPAGGTFWARLLKRNPHYPGRFARVRRGFVASPWTWDTFLDELYVIDSITGPDARGQVRVVLKDPLKLADRNKVPAPTDGKLAVALASRAQVGLVRAAASNTVTLAVDALAVDAAYVGMEIVIVTNTGAGQRRTITAYDGTSRVATVDVAWEVLPTGISDYQVHPLSLTLESGRGAQYADPATSGKREFVRIGTEILEYTAKSGDVLSWPSATYRAQFGSTLADHKAGSTVQLCRAFVGATPTSVVQALLNESGLSDTYIDTAQLAAEEATWFGVGYEVTACLSEPTTPSEYLTELLPQLSAVVYWSPQAQKAVFRVLLPSLASPPAYDETAHLVEGSVGVENLDELRATAIAVYYAQEDATAKGDQVNQYGRAEIAIDADAEGANEYGDRRVQVLQSRWFGPGNLVAMSALARRRLNTLRDAPKRVKFALDPKDYTLPAGELASITTRLLPDLTGAPAATRVLVTRVDDQGGRVLYQGRTTGFARRYGFIAPDSTADYPTEKTYAHVAGNSGLMSDGSEGYLII